MNSESLHISADIIKRLKQGDVHAYDHIYSRYCHKLYLFVYKILKDDKDAEDIVQEVFIKLWERRAQIDDHKKLDSLIFTIAYNSSIDLIRKRMCNNRYLEQLKYSTLLQDGESSGVEAETEYNELKTQLDQLIDSLPERQRQVFFSHRDQGLTYSEIAFKLGISKNTVENHMVKALRFLRNNLKMFLPIIRFFTF